LVVASVVDLVVVDSVSQGTTVVRVTTSVVVEPTGQLVTVGAHEVMV
jgi:hypothetical protein